MATFHCGLNLGGWLSQCEDRGTREHFERFITETDLRRIAEWGFDHVRLPVDSSVLCDSADQLRPEMLAFVDRCLDWCGRYCLGLQLDMHELPGYNIATPVENRLFEDPTLRSRACGIWHALATHFSGAGEIIRFELLNEPEWPNGYAVQDTFQQIIRAIRETDLDRILIMGGNHYDHVDYLGEIRVPEDERVRFTFHYYDPVLFTNQGYGAARGLKDAYPGKPVYPGSFPGLKEYLDRYPEKAAESGKYCWIPNDRALMEANLQKAVDFRRFTGREIGLGEFGVCYHAAEDRRLAWTADLLEICRRERIDWCWWTYKEMDYGLVDLEGKVISGKLLKLLQQAIQ